MHCRWIHAPLGAALLLCASAALAAEEPKPAAKPTSATQSKSAEPAKAGAQKKKPKPVEINSATAAQLKTVPGISDADAQRIIVNRPYTTRSHLVTKNVLSYDAYLAVKDYLSVVPPDVKAKK
jgi:DNA uptake protein ComE-like DNA-binding protein